MSADTDVLSYTLFCINWYPFLLVLILFGFIICTIAGISKIATVACLVNGLLPRKGPPGKHLMICDFVPDRSFPLHDKDGGSFAFSCLKKSSMFDSGLACRKIGNSKRERLGQFLESQ